MENQDVQHDVDLENLREQLADQHRAEFFDSLKNPEDPLAERYSMIAVASKALSTLLDIEESFVQDQMEDHKKSKELCLNCFKDNITDIERIRSVIIQFNNYLDNEDEEH